MMSIAILCIALAIISIALAFIYQCSSNLFIGISTTFATLAGAILVFSTLELQRKALEEEICKNECSRFDSKFFPILSNFRMDAANMESILDRIREKGKGYGFPYASSFYGDRAFFIYRKLLDFLYTNVRKDSYEEYNEENIRIEIDEFDKIEEYLEENLASENELDRIIEKRVNYLHSMQGSYILYKYGISKDIWQKYKDADEQVLISFLFDKQLSYQPAIMSKYIETLRFILHLIRELPENINKKDYYLNVSCRLGKEEVLFLKRFKEFDLLTNDK